MFGGIGNKETAGSVLVVGIDHGYANCKLSGGSCFKSGVTAYDKEPTFGNDILVYNGKYYRIGEGHKAFIADKVQDEDYYILTLAGIAKELQRKGLTTARVHIAAGLPLTWVSEQKRAFLSYLMKNEAVDFTYKDIAYHVEIAGADVFPQGFATVADRLHTFSGTNMLADIGNGTMNVMNINECRPIEASCFTEKYGTHQCMIAAKEAVMRQTGAALDEAVIDRVIRTGTADIGEKYLATIREVCRTYTAGIFTRLREHEYNPDLMRLYIVGGGGCMAKNFGQYDDKRVTIIDNICATARGYKYLAERKLRKAGVPV